MRLTILALAAASLATSACAQSGVTTSLDLSYSSKYVWRGTNLDNEAVLQPNLAVSYMGWTANVWGNFELTDANNYYLTATGKNRITEWDTSLAYTATTPAGSFTFGIVHYDFPNTGFASTTEVWGSLGFKGDFGPTISVYYDLDESKGIYGKIGGSHTLSLSEAGMFTMNGWVGYGDQKNNSHYYGNNVRALADYGVEAKYSMMLGQQFNGWLQVGYYGLLDNNHLAGAPNRTNFVYSAGIGTKF